MTLPRFYPIFDDAAWLDRVLPLGVRLVQLRVKDRSPAETRAETGAEVYAAKAVADALEEARHKVLYGGGTQCAA